MPASLASDTLGVRSDGIGACAGHAQPGVLVVQSMHNGAQPHPQSPCIRRVLERHTPCTERGICLHAMDRRPSDHSCRSPFLEPWWWDGWLAPSSTIAGDTRGGSGGSAGGRNGTAGGRSHNSGRGFPRSNFDWSVSLVVSYESVPPF